jgi:ArsR family transcriptional regulator, virulence genes transcriptional regulator
LSAVDREKLARELIDNVDETGALLKAMANEKRLVILCHLLQGEKSVGEMEELLDLSQSALSQHLARLRVAKIVKTRRSAQTIYYSLNGVNAEVILTALNGLSGAPQMRQPQSTAA